MNLGQNTVKLPPKMVSQPIMNTIQKAGTQNMGLGLKGSSLHRTHYSAPSANGYHQHHHIYHVSDAEGYGHGHSHSDHGGGSGGGGKKRSIALSALTLLAFLFFLNILQNCIEDQMDDMNQQQVIVMTSRLQQAKETQKRTAELQALAAESNTAKKSNNEGNYEKLHRKVDTVSNSHSYDNVSIKINNKNKNRIGRP